LDADNELYDFGCDLVEAATRISRTAADPDAARAVPALLGCIEAALEELSRGCAALQHANMERLDGRLERGYTNLRVALQDARDASHAARRLTARRLVRE
jgi:hypothetical protein